MHAAATSIWLSRSPSGGLRHPLGQRFDPSGERHVRCPNPAPTKNHKVEPDADLSAFDRMMISLGLAQAPEPPEDKGNPSIRGKCRSRSEDFCALQHRDRSLRQDSEGGILRPSATRDWISTNLPTAKPANKFLLPSTDPDCSGPSAYSEEPFSVDNLQRAECNHTYQQVSNTSLDQFFLQRARNIPTNLDIPLNN